MKVRTKLIIGFSLFVILMWAIVVHAGTNLSSLNAQFSAVEEDILPDNIAMTELETLSNHIYREVSEYLYHGTDESRNTALGHLVRLEEIGMDYLPDVAMPGMMEHGKDSDLAGKIFDFYFSSLWIIELKERGADYDTIHTRDYNMTLPALLAMQESASNIKAVGVTELTAVKEAVNETYDSSMRSMYISAVFISLLAIATGIMITRSIARPLIALRKGTEMVARGDLDYKVGTEANDEIGELSRDFDKMTESLSTSMTSIDNLNQEIAERIQAEKALQESEEKFSKAFHASPDAISISTLSDGSFLEVNDSYTRILGYSREELIGENATALGIWADPGQQEIMLKKISKRIRMHNEEYSFRSKSGEMRTMLFSSEYIQIKGEPCMLAVSVDITERKRIEEALKEREKRFSDIVENALEWIWEVDVNGKYVYSSPVVEQILGYKQKEMLKKYFYDLFIPEEREELKKAAFEAFAQKQPIKNFINKNIRKDGRTVYLMTSGVPVFDEDNNWTGYRGVDTDITENIQAEQALKESEEKFSRAFFSSPEIMVIIDQENGQYIDVNDSFLKITGYSRDEIIGKKIEELVILTEEDEAKMNRLLEEQGKVTGEEFRFRMKSGEILTWLCSIELITLGGVSCMLAAATDITGRKRGEQLQKDENHVLTLLGQGAEQDELLDAIVRMGETHDPAIKGSILLFDPSKEMLLQAAGPNLPPDYKEMMNNGVPIGPIAGSCGTAAYKKERVIIQDIETSPLFAPFTDVVQQLTKDGLLACWSQPILASNGDLLGTIANYSTKKGEPEPINLIILEWSARTAAIAIERKRAEQALKESEEKFSKAFRSSPQQVIITRIKDGITLDVNDSFIRSTGFTREETVGCSAEVLDVWVNPEDRDRMMRLLNEQGRIVNEEFQFRKKSGEIHTDLLSVEMVNISGDECMLSLLTDITERKMAEEALRLSDAAFKSIHESVIVTDLDGYITHWNEISEQMFGIKAEDATGKKFLNVIDIAEDYPGESEDRIAAINEAGHWEDQRLYHTPKGDIWVDVHLQDIADSEKHYGRVMLASDITQRKQAEEKLRKALAELERSNAQLAATNKELEAFSYSVSHDLRSPLRSIDGFSQALLEDYGDKFDETGKDFLERLRNASQKMGELIDGLLKLSRLTRSEMHRESVDLSSLAEDITSRLQETRQGRHAKFSIDKGLSVNGDPQLLRVLLENLLSNAWKFTRKKPEAKIKFGAVKNNGKKTYFVKDNGAGFDMMYSDKLFGAFQRLHDSTDFPGTGIGLATVQRIINRHGGTIRAEGTPGKGATFYFTLD